MGAGLAIAVWLLGVTHASASEAGDSIGEVAAVEGQTVVIRGTERQAEPLSVGSPLYQRDIVRTQDDSKAKLVFDDDSIVTLGENTTLEITEYVYSPETGQRSSLLTVAEGIFRAVIDQIVPDSRFEVHTLTTVASVRATDWMAEATPDATAVVALTGAVRGSQRERGGAGAKSSWARARAPQCAAERRRRQPTSGGSHALPRSRNATALD